MDKEGKEQKNTVEQNNSTVRQENLPIALWVNLGLNLSCCAESSYSANNHAFTLYSDRKQFAPDSHN